MQRLLVKTCRESRVQTCTLFVGTERNKLWLTGDWKSEEWKLEEFAGLQIRRIKLTNSSKLEFRR